MIRLEGRGDCWRDLCRRCHTNPATYRCEDCQDLELYCKGCSLDLHSHSPLHRLKMWVKTRFRRVSLKSMGMRIQLGHPVGQHCVNPSRAFGNGFILIDLTGIHVVDIDFCGCEFALSRPVQLLRARIFPATSVEPKTGATFQVLEYFHIESAQAGMSAQAFYNTLARHTDNTGLDPPRDRYAAFLRIMRDGRGYDPGGVKTTAPGELAVPCPACPHPGKNLTMDWSDAPAEKRWLYRLFVGIDGNFRLKRRNVSSNASDPSLTNGQAYFVEEFEYKTHIQVFGKKIKEEKSTCNNHNAVALANTKGYESLAASGVVSVQCTRHEMKRPSSVGDLQRGEHYVNVDYVFFSSMRDIAVMLIVILYDIACQWAHNFWNRIHTYGPTVDYDKNTTFLIPKFHLPAHQTSCQNDYSFNLTKGVGRTDGEAPECSWALTNVFGPSTKEIGPGARHDLLDDVFGDHNWRKVAKLPSTLLKKVKRAAESHHIHTLEFEEFNTAILTSQTAKWKTELDNWEWRLRMDVQALGPYAPDLQRSKVLERRNNLQRRLDNWTNIQTSYIAGVDTIRSRLMSAVLSTIHAEAHSLLLPSKICAYVPCHAVFLDYEWRLWEGQAHEALDNLRRHLRLQTYLHKFKKQFVVGQWPNTRARSSIESAQQKVNMDVATYRAAHVAMNSLALFLNKSNWQAILQRLEDDDVRAISDGQIFESKGHQMMSWIWKIAGVSHSDDDSDPALHEALRIEWCRSRARADRWNEECNLLKEEMRRTIQFHKWQEIQWLSRAKAVLPTVTPDYVEGLIAFAHRQADIRSSMHKLCEKSWRDVPTYIHLGISDEPPPLELIPEESEFSLTHLDDQVDASDPDPSSGYPQMLSGDDDLDMDELFPAAPHNSVESLL
ncbi:hypothetical protein OBBRIDRAFT_812834 [Obba rivulosa]|uniref:CxC2-like cysteine cluster KDZ transposase-associated domain-containing protein n=1 Tax=Obba rivulosa TaxID=1052685 RepID=A0A8E2ATM3_9APHY|nr:hypothetical protein OBBRIDRAFT_812834 [Obba rivulosa]